MDLTNILMGAVTIALLCGALYFLVPAYTEYQEHKNRVEKLDRKLTHQRDVHKTMEEQVHALRTDPEAVERVAREKFGWGKPQEKIYHFEEIENDSTSETPVFSGSDSE